MQTLTLAAVDFTQPFEDIDLEFKAAGFALPKNFWDTVSAFSNTEGGIILLGVDEHPHRQYHIVGVDVPEAVLEQLWNENDNVSKINRSVISPKNVTQYKQFGKTLIQIYVPKAPASMRPIFINGNRGLAFIRTGDGDRQGTDDEYKYLIVDSQLNVDAELLENYDLADLNLDDVHSYKDLMSIKHSKPEIMEKDDFDFLKDIGVFRKDRKSVAGQYKLTTGGLLFFGKYNAIIDRFPNFQLDYFRYATNHGVNWEDRVSSGDMNFPEMNVYSFYTAVIAKLPITITDRFTQSSGLIRSSYASDIRLAVKEALVNALMHPYYDGSIPIKVVDRQSFFEFTNPGTMRVSLESFIRGADSQTRNGIIATLFRKVGIAERAGSGGPRIFESASKNRLHSPDVLIKDYATVVRIWKVDLLSSIKDDISLTDAESALLEVVVQEARWYKMSDFFDVLQDRFSKWLIRKAVSGLLEKRIIVTVGRAQATRYAIRLSPEQSAVENIRVFKFIEDFELGYRQQ
ncbi:RNA-binding domain-containing protein [Lacticaseibacillus kribbianus]|uniref:RNA-binding domain-containing protein n=1 Tax=Lacticaseibacillus kribbianus TaxID=2926292 RepID=UPI001CD72C08|nr:RNA-binding domain-containing protein [Lacticaseibacillus kribbianus]